MNITFDGYPAHATLPSELPPAILARLRAYAVGLSGAIIATQLTQNLIDLLVEGHADFDNQGREFEFKISQQRADNCRTLLLGEVAISLQNSLTSLSNLKRLTITPMGWGTTRPVFSHPASDSERESNRRVVLTFAPGPPVAPIDDSVQRALAVIQGLPEGGRKRRLNCMLTKLRDIQDIADGYPDFAEAHRVPGSGGFPNLSADQWTAAVKGFMVHVKPQVASVMSGGSADDQRAGLLGIDDNIGRNIFNWVSQANAGAATAVFDQLVIAFIQNQMANPKSVLACYAGYQRSNPDL